MKVLKLFAFLVCMSPLAAKAQVTQYPNFSMYWGFCDADGGNERGHNDYCRCGSVYVKNLSTYRFNSNPTILHVPAMTGTYQVYNAVGTSPGTHIYSIPASSWAYGQVVEIPLGCTQTFDYADGLNFRIQYVQGPGENVTPYAPGAASRSLYLKTRTVAVNAGPDKTVCSGTALNITPSGAETYSWNPPLPAVPSLSFFDVTPVSTDYTLTGTTRMGSIFQDDFYCSATDVVRVTVNPVPFVMTPVIATPLCTGTPLPGIHGPSGMYNYSWTYNGNVLLLQNSSSLNTAPYGYGTYRVSYSNIYGCYVTSGPISINLSPSAAANFTPAFSSAVTNSGLGAIDINVTASESGEHKWDLYGSNASGTLMVWLEGSSWSSSSAYAFGPLSADEYFVVKHTIRRAPCNEEESLTRTFYESRSARSKKDASGGSSTEFQVSPNPSNGIFTVTLDGDAAGTVEVLDMQGKKVFTRELKDNTNTCEIDLSAYPKGVYLINMTGADGFQSKKIIIE